MMESQIAARVAAWRILPAAGATRASQKNRALQKMTSCKSGAGKERRRQKERQMSP
jgi:hypothetical protein